MSHLRLAAPLRAGHMLRALGTSARRGARPVLIGALVLGATVMGTRDAHADAGNVAVTATSVAKFTFSISVGALAFGAALDPAGGGAVAPVVSYVDPADSGAYYVNNGTPATFAVVVTIKSNKAYTGNVAAPAGQTGTSGQPLASLKWKLGDITDYVTANGATAFTVATDASAFTAASTCSSGTALAKGNCVFNYDYALNVLWTQDPGTFIATVTYTGTQS